MRRRVNLNFISVIAGLLIVTVCAGVILGTLSGLSRGYDDRRAQQIRETVISCVAQCYALEGKYPPDLKYLSDHYGLQLDSGRYIYYYGMFATNIFPDVKVFAKGDGG